MSDPQDQARIADAPPENWVDSYAPAWVRPYTRLARLDRPIGWWLLLLPCWWSVALASQGTWPPVLLLLLFFIGAVAMRGAGCTWNDIVDRDIDGAVERTRLRPLPSGAVTLKGALFFLVLQCLVGLAVLLSFNGFAVALGFSSLILVAIYPFMKRITYWPQFVLGLAFNWGALMGWAAIHGSLSLAPVFLYLGAVAWTIGYDTIYAHQDKEDDALIGVKSTALKFGASTKKWLWGFYGFATLAFIAAGAAAGLGSFFYPVLTLGAALLIWQIATLDINDPARCLLLFRSNRDFGLVFFVAIIAGQIF